MNTGNTNGGESAAPAPAAEPTMTVGETGYNVNDMMDISVEDSDPVELDGEEKTPGEELGLEDNEDPEADPVGDDEDDSAGSESDETSTEGEDPDSESQKVEDGIKVKSGDKEIDIPKDGEVEVKIDGKVESMTMQEVINKASGVIHVERETAQLGRDRKELQTEKTEFNTEAAKVQANAEAMLAMDDPYELCEYIGELKGEDPDKIFDTMMQKTVESLEKFSNMTERELELHRENRRLTRASKAQAAKDKVANETKEASEKRANLDKELNENGFSFEDFNKTIEDLSQLAAEGKELGYGLDESESFTEEEIVNYMVAKDLDDRVLSGLDGISPKLREDTNFVNDIKKTLIKTETLHGKLSEAEVTTFLKQALEVNNKALSESLSKKVDKTKSKIVNSHEQEEDDDEGYDTLEDLYAGQRSNV